MTRNNHVVGKHGIVRKKLSVEPSGQLYLKNITPQNFEGGAGNEGIIGST
jgi:hypothetical protein